MGRLRVFNTMSQTKEEFVPLNPPKVGMYVCGITSYDSCHIGHARAYVAFDVVQRYLRYCNFDVTYVRNFTDIDDKIIKRAHELGLSPFDVSARYIREFYEDMDALGVQRPQIEPKVTEHIPQIIESVKKILEHGFAYEAQGDVYYDTSKFSDYLRLSRRNKEEMLAGASGRVDPLEPNKRHPFDFALWKKAKEGEPSWDSPWGRGRPGWHIECSTMSSLYLGDVFDIHGGGMDLIFPHHENERAQSYALCGREFVRYWLHNGFVTVGEDQQKMAKSLKNFFTIKDVRSMFDAEALRYFLLTTHYRSPINFSLEGILASEENVDYLYETILAGTSATDGAEINTQFVEKEIERFEEAMDDDFNTAVALAVLLENARALNECLRRKNWAMAKTHLVVIRKIGGVLGLGERDPKKALSEVQEKRIERAKIDKELVERLVAERSEARKNKDFGRADALRDELTKMGVLVMDQKDGTRWKVTNVKPRE